MTHTAPPDQIKDLTPATKAVFLALHLRGESTLVELINTTRLSDRAIGDALHTLRRRDIVDDRPCLTDARKTWYFLTDEAPEAIPK